jgi:hypothetical protein
MPDGVMNVDYDGLIPNNVGLAQDLRVRKALETWHPGYIDWWKDMGPEGFQESLVYLRTAISVDPKGWAKFDYVKMPEYKWGVLLAPAVEGRTIGFGAHKGEPVWQEVPGEYRAMLRRLLVIQGDTEPASVEQQRHLGATAPSLYDMSRKAGICGRWSICCRNISAPKGAKRPTNCWRAAPAMPTRRGCSVRSTNRRRTGSHSSCSLSSPIAMARCNSRRWRNRALIRSPAPVALC